ncbi:hypothetical protein Syun_024898 [Stephania yunnanensis]|uniref:Pentatricopeptide repeat-containing protein n=1 Tax=Stephania yunnanensis TaxID=152371 RepID=A0AAP0EXR1_9MAGN
MILGRASVKPNKVFQTLKISTKSSNPSHQIDRITKLINDHPYPDPDFHKTLHTQIPPSLLCPQLVSSVLARLFSGHSNSVKAVDFFKFCSESLPPTPNSLEKALHILARNRDFDGAYRLMKAHPMLITHKAMGIVLSKLAKFRSFEDTLEGFERLEREVLVGRAFGVGEFNVLIRVLCLERQMKDARVVFGKMLSRFSPNLQTFNILLLGFKESGDVTAVELFYNEMVRRGFKPNVVSYSIRIDAYCKKGCVGDGLRLVDEMERLNLMPTLEILTTLIHGAGIARNVSRARELFDEIAKRGLAPDIGAYNALIGCYFRCRDVESGLSLMGEMEEKGVGLDHVSYHTLFLGLKRSHGMEGVYMVYQRMVERKFVPKMYTVVMLMKFFCENRRPDLGLELWRFLVDRGCCPHEHAMDLLVTGLCCVGRMEEAYDCLIQMAERGRPPGKRALQVLVRFLVKAGKTEKLHKLSKMTNMS